MAERHTDPRDHAVPLFPQYVFLRCDLTAHYFQIRYAPGVASFLQEGATLFPFRKAL
jgi:transcription antitermination factor NusG